MDDSLESSQPLSPLLHRQHSNSVVVAPFCITGSGPASSSPASSSMCHVSSHRVNGGLAARVAAACQHGSSMAVAPMDASPIDPPPQWDESDGVPTSPYNPAAMSRGRISRRHFREVYGGREPYSMCYLVYCILCFVLTGTLFAATLFEGSISRKEAKLWRRRLRPWEETVESFVGAALVTETFAMLRMLGWRRFCRSGWHLLDALIAGLTLVCGLFFCLRRAVHQVGDVVEDFDVPFLGLRFLLQPIRMCSTASMVVRARRMQRSPEVAALPATPVEVDPRLPCTALTRPIFTSFVASQVRDLLPCHLRYSDWELVYSPSVHGTSMNTFYRCQGGPNVIVVRDAAGHIFGGFANAPWRATTTGYGVGEAFVFAVVPEAGKGKSTNNNTTNNGGSCRVEEGEPLSPLSTTATEDDERQLSHDMECAAAADDSRAVEVKAFWGAHHPSGLPPQWSDTRMLGLGKALVVFDDFLRGSSSACETFCSEPLSQSGTDFVIRDFECWQVGDERGG
mmetsp:Transcript_89204/g.195522  ORF Transcript_89204/g.195522 Transcript_89204/m.195522 type:complete len:510 (-) Transcript_89204:177-1706(-)